MDVRIRLFMLFFEFRFVMLFLVLSWLKGSRNCGLMMRLFTFMKCILCKMFMVEFSCGLIVCWLFWLYSLLCVVCWL